MVYTSSEPALAILEYFVNLEIAEAPPDLVMVSAELGESMPVEMLDVAKLPGAWRTTPAPAALARLGTEWAERMRAVALAVPSAVVPIQQNYLLNPRHPEFRQIRLLRPESISLDPRMWTRRRGPLRTR